MNNNSCKALCCRQFRWDIYIYLLINYLLKSPHFPLQKRVLKFLITALFAGKSTSLRPGKCSIFTAYISILIKAAIYAWNHVGSVFFREEAPSLTAVITLKKVQHDTGETHLVHQLQQNRSYLRLGAISAAEYDLPSGNHRLLITHCWFICCVWSLSLIPQPQCHEMLCPEDGTGRWHMPDPAALGSLWHATLVLFVVDISCWGVDLPAADTFFLSAREGLVWGGMEYFYVSCNGNTCMSEETLKSHAAKSGLWQWPYSTSSSNDFAEVLANFGEALAISPSKHTTLPCSSS